MKIALLYNYESQAVINLFGIPNREKYGLATIKKIKKALKAGGHQVKAFEGDKNVIKNLEEFMPVVIAGERPGLVFNLTYGIQGRARYSHIPGMLEMLGIPYVGSSPDTHAIALDKVVTKMILMHKGLPTPRFEVIEKPGDPLTKTLSFPLIVKPKDEAVSFGLRIVHNEEELAEGIKNIYEMFKKPTLVEEYIEGREISIGLLGNDPVETLPPVELEFKDGPPIFTYEDKTHGGDREIDRICPAELSSEVTGRLQALALDAFKALGCFDCARVDLRLDTKGNPYILEVNSMASLGPGGSYVYAAAKIGLDYAAVVNRLVEVAAERYFGASKPLQTPLTGDKTAQSIFVYLTRRRDSMEEDLKIWTNLQSRTNDSVGLSEVTGRLGTRLDKLGLVPLMEYTDHRSAWSWETTAGYKRGTLLVVSLDVPKAQEDYPIPFRLNPEWLFGEGIASSRAGIVCLLSALDALRSVKKLRSTNLAVFAGADEGEGLQYSTPLLRQAAEVVKRVIVLQPGYPRGKVVDQRRGSRKYRLIVEGDPLRIGAHTGRIDTLTWFLKRAGTVRGLSQPKDRLTLSVHEVCSERFSILLPHRVRASISMTFLDPKKADQVEKQLFELFNSDSRNIRAQIMRLQERAPLRRSDESRGLIAAVKGICEEWNLPFGVESSLLPSAAGEIPRGVPVVCGFAPACRDLYTPQECIHRAELLQRTLLLALLLHEGD